MTASDKLIRLLAMQEGEAVVIHNPSNMFWVTEGYTGEGLVYISLRRKVIVTDFRYTEQAERQAAAFSCVMADRNTRHSAWVASMAVEDGVTSIRCEEDWLTVSAYKALSEAVPGVSFRPLDGAPQTLREIKTDAEAACIRKACEITSQAYDKILGIIREGMTEKELQIELDFIQLRLGAEGNSFDTIIASGENGSLPHAIPGDRKLRKGDMITMDFGCKFGGYCSDMTRTVALGEPSDTMRKVYDTVLGAQLLGVSLLAPGKVCFDIDRQVREFIDSKGYAGRFGHGLGHSVGIDIHEMPSLGMSCRAPVEIGNVITVEPGIYLPGIGGVRIEDTCLVVPGGCDPLTPAPKALTIL